LSANLPPDRNVQAHLKSTSIYSPTIVFLMQAAAIIEFMYLF